ncbi:hypothetical protein [Thermoactinomyces sp. CICC 10521]|uniref:hypothetical protein n=1 Tax=Thermoactinomyces sp. CICC 10521 TaxID=2767426 RepID=UPI0018DB244D|nr:hypothetical protein [Thermoactinomyces sp. CICC 10521]MBH8608387.1 hypothetical protein [Thermoactinomyces sp. CICC 10521]
MFQIHVHRQGSIESVNIGELVPQDHRFRKIDAAIDFSFIAEMTRPLYCEDNGRLCMDPVCSSGIWLGTAPGGRNTGQRGILLL